MRRYDPSMRWLEVRRHSLTKKGAARGRGSHLSAKGVALARAIGAELGPVAYVVTSASPRSVETAIAMGVAVDETVDLPSGYVPGEVEFHEQWTWAQPYVRYAELIERGGGLARVAQAHRTIWVGAVGQVDEGEVAVFVGHGGAIEPTLVACLPDADHRRWDRLLGHCDGARLEFADGKFVDVEFLRASARPSGPLHSRIRRARPDEAEQLTGLARRSKAHWGYDEEFLRRAAADLTITPPAIAEHEVWVLENDGRIIGFHRVIPGEPAVLEDLWLEPDAIGAGHGRRLWEHAIGVARSGGASAMELDAEPNAMGFYQRMGAVRVGATVSRVIPGRELPRMRVPLDP